MTHRWQLALSLALTFAFAHPVQAKPPYREKMSAYFGHYLPKNLNTCQACHVPDKPGAAEDDHKPHNAFGKRLKTVRDELQKADKKTDIITRLEAIFQEDTDGDGVTNILELLAGHNPGEAKDTPAAAEVTKAKQTLAAFQASGPYPPWPLFQTVKRPPVPTVKNPAWVRNPIDAYIAAGHEEHGLKPRPEASRLVLARRLYLDLTGLPPTPAEVKAFVDDVAPDAYEKLVDKLLDSPRYGERWGRHWMDVWRYADWAGYGNELRESHKHVWRWRDWIVESVNKDKPYDRMIQEMLAADELSPDDPDSLRATGFLVRNWFRYSRDVMLENVVEHTSKAFLGVTLNCARCHEHKFDTKIGQEDYYRFRAFFEPYDVRYDRIPGQLDVEKDALPRAFDAKPATPTFLYLRGNPLLPDKKKPIEPGVPAVLGGSALKVAAVSLPLGAYAPDKRAFVIKDTIVASEAIISNARAALATARRNTSVATAAPLAAHAVPVGQVPLLQRVFDTLVLAELDLAAAEGRHAALLAVLDVEKLEDAGKLNSPEWKEAAIAANAAQRKAALFDARKSTAAARRALQDATAANRADLTKKRDAAEKALIKAEQDEKLPPAVTYTKRPMPAHPMTSTGRRLALARWIADKQNPLTARVAVNHIWLRHFGEGIVPSVFDFGANGQLPTNPALLDWLAAEFMERGWAMKPLHRLMVTSSAYRMASTGDAANGAIDPDNVYLWRMNSRRLEAEAIRDSVLFIGGNLDLAMGGPDLDYKLGLVLPRRSLYFQSALEKQVEFLDTFDGPNLTECYRRTDSIIPQQALAMANSTLALSQSRRLAAALTKVHGDRPTAESNAAFVKAAFEQVLGRAPTAAEQTECEKFLAEQAELLSDPKKLQRFASGTSAPVPPSPVPHQRARENLVHVLMNHNDFVTIR